MPNVVEAGPQIQTLKNGKYESGRIFPGSLSPIPRSASSIKVIENATDHINETAINEAFGGDILYVNSGNK